MKFGEVISEINLQTPHYTCLLHKTVNISPTFRNHQVVILRGTAYCNMFCLIIIG
jgi:hypothetical protein